MKEKPILFSTPMIPPIQADIKTQTRRVIVPQPTADVCLGICTDSTDKQNIGKVGFGDGCNVKEFVRPRYQPGDILWVRETWCKLWELDSNGQCIDGTEKYYYAADGYNPTPFNAFPDEDGFNGGRDCPRWKPSIHMPREAARIFLLVTDVRAERVQDISEEDARAEGVSRIFDHLTKQQFDDWNRRAHLYSGAPLESPQNQQPYTNYLWHGHFGQHGMGNKQSDAWKYQCSGYDSAKDSFSSLWELINAKRGFGWEANPWVFAYTFKQINKEAAMRMEG